jgi:hypothetical protein
LQWERCAAQAQQPQLKPVVQGSNKRVTFNNSGSSSSNETFATPPSSGGSKQMYQQPINFNKIDQPLWRDQYGMETSKGTKVNLCWFHANRPGGCSQQARCKYDHSSYPSAYEGKPLSQQSETFQRSVLAMCQRT